MHPRTPSLRTNYRDVQDEVKLGLLTAIEENSGITQRSVADKLGIALGLANNYIKHCVRKGLIKVKQAPAKRYAYYLTPKGFAEKSQLTARFLRGSFQFMRQAHEDCENVLSELEGKNVKRLVLLGNGDLTDVMLLLVRNYKFEVTEVYSGEVTTNDLKRCERQTDMFVVTCLKRPLELFKTALEALGPDKVKAPLILGLPDPVSLGFRYLQPHVISE